MKRQHHEIGCTTVDSTSSISLTKTSPSWWSNICDEIQSQGGLVADCLQFNEQRRELQVTQSIESGTILFQIPVTAMVTKEWAIRKHPWLQRVVMEEVENGKFHNSATDLILATAMASSSKDLLYLQTLPEYSSFDALPRRWSTNDIDKLLGHTSIYQRVLDAKAGARQDYETLHQIYPNHQHNNHFPSLQEFDDMLAAVTSRAFQIGSSHQTIAMVPLLDLCNHSRGKDMQRNVSYQVQEEEDGKTAMVVRSVVALKPGDPLDLTYGALGNPQLLLNYGFCMANNVEPDGSSNDLLELDCEGTIVPLRAGPKSYSYSGFRKALDAYMDKEGSGREIGEHDGDGDGDEDDFERFLNQAGDEAEKDGKDEDNGGFNSLYASGGMIDDEEEDNGVAKVDTAAELKALLNLRQSLVKKFHALDVRGEDTPPARYAAILCQSERRTLYFFARAAEKVYQQLRDDTDTKDARFEKLGFVADPEDLKLIEAQTGELANVYLVLKGGI